MKCECQDSKGTVCGKRMSKEEKRQDGMCSKCAGQVWTEIDSSEEYQWFHSDSPLST